MIKIDIFMIKNRNTLLKSNCLPVSRNVAWLYSQEKALLVPSHFRFAICSRFVLIYAPCKTSLQADAIKSCAS